MSGHQAKLSPAQRRHLEEGLTLTTRWLCRAQDVTPDGGIAATYTLLRGWSAPFPETTGYLIPTFFNIATLTGDAQLRQRAIRMADWLLDLQAPSGAFPAGVVTGRMRPGVFDTGQIIFGLLRAADETGERRYLEAAWRAGDWLVDIQSDDGAWRRHEFCETPHAYNTRVAWALLLLHERTGNSLLHAAALRHIAWVAALSHDDGFFDRLPFLTAPDGSKPTLARTLRLAAADCNLPSFLTEASLHTIAYTLQGLLECSWLLANDQGERLARKGADELARHLLNGRLSGYYRPGWRPAARSLCLTGVAQMAVVWLRMFLRSGADTLDVADRAISELLTRQKTHGSRDLTGGFAGSSPIWGLYLPFRYPNWAAKFTADAFVLRLALDENPERAVQLAVW